MRKQILAGNWKMNKTSDEVQEFFDTFRNRVNQSWNQVEVMFAVPYTLLAYAREAANGYATILAQNVHYEDSGAYTGEVSIAQLKDSGINGAIVGHSERRQYFAETDEAVAKKVAKLLSEKMLAIACVGETQAEREAERTREVITRQVLAIFAAAPAVDHLVIAYEPVWAIGTGLTASLEQAQEVHSHIRGLARQHYGVEAADSLRILYGGSAKASNIGGLVAQQDIDGGLVGGVSLNPNEFADMIDTVTG